MNRRWLGALLPGFAFGFLLGLLAFVLTARSEDKAAFRTPTEADRKAAPLSSVLIAGAQRSNAPQVRFAERSGRHNQFGISAHYPLPGDFEPIVSSYPRARRFLASENKIAYRGRGELGGKRVEYFIQFRGDPKNFQGLRVRLLRKESRDDGTHYHINNPAHDLMYDYTPKLGSLVFAYSFTAETNSPYRWVYPEFPLRPGARIVGRFFAWDVDREDFKAVAPIIWDELNDDEARAYLQLWNVGYAAADDSHRRQDWWAPSQPEQVPEEF